MNKILNCPTCKNKMMEEIHDYTSSIRILNCIKCSYSIQLFSDNSVLFLRPGLSFLDFRSFEDFTNFIKFKAFQ